VRHEVLGNQGVIALIPTVEEEIGACIGAQYEAGRHDGEDRPAVVAAAMGTPSQAEQENGEGDRCDSPDQIRDRILLSLRLRAV